MYYMWYRFLHWRCGHVQNSLHNTAHNTACVTPLGHVGRLGGQTEKQTQAGKALQIAWGDGNTISITVPLEGKHAVHVHPIKSAKESRYTAVRAEVTRQGNIATVQISGIFGTIKEFTCKAIGEMPQDRLGTYSLSLDKNDSVRIQDFENQESRHSKSGSATLRPPVQAEPGLLHMFAWRHLLRMLR